MSDPTTSKPAEFFGWRIFEDPTNLDAGLRIHQVNLKTPDVPDKIVCKGIQDENVAELLILAPTRTEQVIALSNGWHVARKLSWREDKSRLHWAAPISQPGSWPGMVQGWEWMEPDGNRHWLPGDFREPPPWSEELRDLLHDKWRLHSVP